MCWSFLLFILNLIEMIKVMHGIIYCLQQLTPGDNSPEMLLVIHHRQEGLVDQQVKVLLHVKGIGNRRGIRLHDVANHKLLQAVNGDPPGVQQTVSDHRQ